MKREQINLKNLLNKYAESFTHNGQGDLEQQPEVSERKTSDEWLKSYPELTILDPDGWDRKNYDYSFYLEEITKEEFDNRVCYSTCQLSHHPHLGSTGFEHLPNDVQESGAATDHTVIPQPISEERIEKVWKKHSKPNN